MVITGLKYLNVAIHGPLTQAMVLNIFTLSSEISHTNIIYFVSEVVRAIAPNIYGINVYNSSQVSNNCLIALSRPCKSLLCVGVTPDILFL
jgi:hypothetical protein